MAEETIPVERMRPIQTPLDRTVQPGNPNAIYGPREDLGAVPQLTADDLVRGQQQASGLYSLDPNYRPAPEQPNRPQLKPSQWLGNGQVNEGVSSGGDYIGAATMVVPTFEIDRSIQNIQKQKEDISKWMEDAMGQFKGRAADPYQKAYQDYVSQEHNRFFQDIADTYYGGDRSKAIQAARRDPELNRQWQNVNRSLGAIGDANKGGYAYYEKVADAITKGQAEVDPETQKLLNEGLNGEWAFNGMGPAHNAAQFDRLNDRLSLNKLFDDFYSKGAKDAGDIKADEWSVVTKGGRKFLVIPSEKSYDEFVESFVDQAMKDAPYRDKEEVRKFVEARVPRESTVKVNELALGTSGRSGSTPESKVWSSPVTTRMANTATGGRLAETVSKDGVKRRTPAVQSISVGEVVDGKQQQFKQAAQFMDGNTPVKMIFTSIDRGADGSTMLVGYDPASTEIATNIDDLTTRIADLNAIIRSPYAGEEEQKAKATVERDKLLKELRVVEKSVQKRMVPLKGNEGVVNGLLGGRLQQELAKFGAAPATGGAAKNTADPLGIL